MTAGSNRCNYSTVSVFIGFKEEDLPLLHHELFTPSLYGAAILKTIENAAQKIKRLILQPATLSLHSGAETFQQHGVRITNFRAKLPIFRSAGFLKNRTDKAKVSLFGFAGLLQDWIF